MAPQLTVTMTADEARLLKALDKVIQKEDQVRKGLKNTGDESKKAGDKLAQGFGPKLTGQLRSMVGGFVSAGAAMALFNQKLEDSKRLGQEALQANRNIGQAQAAVIKNLGLGVSDADSKKFLASVAKIQAETGFGDQSALLQGASSILSATGGDQQKSLDILRQSAIFMKDQPGQIGEFGGAMGDVMKATGSNSAQETAAFMLAMQGQARFEDLGAFKNVAPVLAANRVITTGDQATNAREAGALVAGVGQQLGDPNAAVTKTAVIALAAKLEQTFPKIETTFGRLEALQKADQATRDEFLKAGFEVATKPVIRELVNSAESDTAKAVQQAFAAMQSSGADAANMQRQLATLTPQTQQQTFKQLTDSIFEQFKAGQLDVGSTPDAQLSGSDSAQIAAIREMLFKSLENTRGAEAFAGVGESVGAIMFDVNAQSAEEANRIAVEALKERQAILQRSGLFGMGGQRELKDLSPQEREQVELLQTMINLLEQISRNREREHADGVRREAAAANQPD